MFDFFLSFFLLTNYVDHTNNNLDPYSFTKEELVPVIDSYLRRIALSILTTTDKDTGSNSNIIIPEMETPKQLIDAVYDCLSYLRDRVGVPRDMGVHAAKQLRSHINLVMKK